MYKVGENVKNKNGFTLIELLATLVILSVIMLVAVPSTMSVLDKNRRESFVSDAKRFVALAESEIRNNDKIDTEYGGVIIFKLADLNEGSFDKDPDGKQYSQDASYVAVYKKGTAADYQFEYYVQMYGESRGISLMHSKNLERSSITSALPNRSIDSAVATAIGRTPTTITYFE